MADTDAPAKLKGEGGRRVQRRVRATCENCNDPATVNHTFLLPNARRNPQSSACGKDDISWCSDMEALSCDDCVNEIDSRGRERGYEPCSRFQCVDRFAHMFLKWVTFDE